MKHAVDDRSLFLTGPQQGCGGYLTNSSDSFGSPDSDMDGKYDKDLECVWVIAAPINKLINLTFNTFQLEAESSVQNCRYDYVQVRSVCANQELQGTLFAVF